MVSGISLNAPTQRYHCSMKFRDRTLVQIADMICGNVKKPEEGTFFNYRSSSSLNDFFREADTDYLHDGSTRKDWVAGVLAKILAEPQANANTPPETFSRVIRLLMEPEDAQNEGRERSAALAMLNSALYREGFEAFYAPDKHCYLRHIATSTVATALQSPHRPFSAEELERRDQLIAYLS